MKTLLLLTALLAVHKLAQSAEPRMVCYYDTTAITRLGDAKFTHEDMEVALQFCTHMIYGYAGITPNTFAVTPLNTNQEQEFAQMQKFKEKFPHIKFLLSLGGDRDTREPVKYLDLLEAGYQRQQTFISSAIQMLQKYKFDGFDLAYQLPRNKPKTFHRSYGKAWKSVKKIFTGNFVVDKKTKERKKMFTELVNLLKINFKPHNYMLSLTALPNVNLDWYFDAPSLAEKLDFITLAAFDFSTPERNPQEADFAAPMHAPPAEGNRMPDANIDSQVNQWLTYKVPRHKLNVGLPTWGRAWKMTEESKRNAEPVVTLTNGPAAAGKHTKTPGLLSWPEVCAKFRQHPTYGDGAPLRRVPDKTKKYGNYAFSVADKYGNNGLWVSYEEPQTASYKAGTVRKRNLGGVALFDIGLDDLRGVCTGDKFPILRAIKTELI